MTTEIMGTIESEEQGTEVVVERDEDEEIVRIENHALREEPVTVAEMGFEKAQEVGTAVSEYVEEGAEVDIPQGETWRMGQHPLSGQIAIHPRVEEGEEIDVHAVFDPEELAEIFQ